jgi:hypothetical protein
MNFVSSAWQSIRGFVVRYPAVLSGYIIYSYLFLCIIRYFMLTKAGEVSMIRTYETFVAIPFLWLLSLSLVKVIDIRTQLHGSETQRLQAQQELNARKLQLTTLKEVVRGVQDKVNNPLAIISLSADRITRAVPESERVIAAAEQIKHSTHEISAALAGFRESEEYRVADVGAGVGNIAMPSGRPLSDT